MVQLKVDPQHQAMFKKYILPNSRIQSHLRIIDQKNPNLQTLEGSEIP